MSDSNTAPTFRWGAKFSPHVLVFLLTLYVQIPPLRGTIVSFVNWWWDSTYTTIDFVMDEGRPNDGSPYIAGHLDDGTEINLGAQMEGSTIVVRDMPQEPFAVGKRIPIWHSESAPTFGVFGASVNNLPVAVLPVRPGLASLLLHLLWFGATWVVGLLGMGWVAARWARTWGTMPIRHRTGTRLGR